MPNGTDHALYSGSPGRSKRFGESFRGMNPGTTINPDSGAAEDVQALSIGSSLTDSGRVTQ